MTAPMWFVIGMLVGLFVYWLVFDGSDDVKAEDRGLERAANLCRQMADKHKDNPDVHVVATLLAVQINALRL